jgi:hypothetical protein
MITFRGPDRTMKLDFDEADIALLKDISETREASSNWKTHEQAACRPRLFIAFLHYRTPAQLPALAWAFRSTGSPLGCIHQ